MAIKQLGEVGRATLLSAMNTMSVLRAASAQTHERLNRLEILEQFREGGFMVQAPATASQVYPLHLGGLPLSDTGHHPSVLTRFSELNINEVLSRYENPYSGASSLAFQDAVVSFLPQVYQDTQILQPEMIVPLTLKSQPTFYAQLLDDDPIILVEKPQLYTATFGQFLQQRPNAEYVVFDALRSGPTVIDEMIQCATQIKASSAPAGDFTFSAC